MVTINKANIATNIWETVYDAVKTGVTTVTLADSTVQTIKVYTSSFPDTIADTKDSYPILIVNPVHINWENFTISKKLASGTFTIDIYTTKGEAADIFSDNIIDTIETNRDDFKKLKINNIMAESTTSDEFFRGQIKLHVKSTTFSFDFIFTGSI